MRLTRSLSVGMSSALVLAGVVGVAAPAAAAPNRAAAVGSASHPAAPSNSGPIFHSGAPAPTRGARRPAAANDLGSTLGAAPAAASGSGEKELPALRTVSSRTYSTPRGARRLVATSGPMNYRDGAGVLQPIDDSLVASGGGYYNLANSYGVQFPADISLAPITVTAGSSSLSFRLRGAQSSRGVVKGNTISYPAVLPGVSVTYSANPAGMQESFTLANAGAPASYAFDVTASPGLSSVSANGGIDFRTPQGATALSLAPPYVSDSGPDFGGDPRAVSLTLGRQAGGLSAVLALTPGWLTAPGRVFPVTIDPDIDPSGTALTDCHVVSGRATTSYCINPAVDVGNYANTYGLSRTLVKLDTSPIPAESTVLDAQVNFQAYQLLATSGAVSMQLFQNNQAWTTAATWNTTNGSTGWSSGGGGAPSPAVSWTGPAGPNLVSSGTAPYGRYSWYGTSTVQSWVNGSAVNNGFLLRAANEAAAGIVRFGSSHNSSNPPDIDVEYYPPVGQQSIYTYTSQQLTGHASAAVNVATGNLIARTDEISVRGTGTSAPFTHYYNSALAKDLIAGYGDAPDGATLTPGWTGTLNQETYLSRGGPIGVQGSVTMFAEGGAPLVFNHPASATNNFTAPAGVNATLVLGTVNQPAFGSFDTVIFHDSGLTYHFDAGTAGDEVLVSITTKNGKTINVNGTRSCVCSTSPPATSVTDTQGRNFPYGYTVDNNFNDANNGLSFLTSLGDTAGGRAAAFGFNSDFTHLTSYTDPAGGSYQYGYDPVSNLLTSITTPAGRSLTVAYDSAGRVASTSRSTGGTTLSTRYAYLGNDGGAPAGSVGLTQLTDPAGNITKYYFNSQREVIRTTDPLGRHRDKSFDPATGNVMSLTNNLSQVSTLAYDTSRNLSKIQAPSSGGSNSPVTTTFNGYSAGAQPQPTSVKDPQNNVSTFAVDGASQVTGVTGPGPSSAKTTLSYNGDGTVASSTDANNNITRYGYTGGNLTGITPPAPLGATSIGPDADSRPHTITDGNGHTTTNTYDRLDRITNVGYPDGTSISYGFDGDDNLTARTDRDGASTSIGYDGLSRPTSQNFRGTSQTFGYDASSNLTGLTDPGGTVGYGYNAAGDVTSVTEPGGNCTGFSLTANPQALPAAGSGCTLFHYDGNARRDQQATPGGVLQVLSYDNAGHQTEIKASQGATVLSDLAYSYTKPGTSIDTSLRQNVTDKLAGKTTSYSYDELNRLTAATGVLTGPGTTADYHYGYDNNGNRTSSSVNGGPNPGYSYNGANQLTATGGTTAGYDGAGNLTSTSAGFAAGYDTANTTTSATNPTGGAGSTFSYADAGQTVRLTAGSTSFTQSVLGLASTAAGGTLSSYTRDPAGNLIAQRTGNTPGQTANSYYLRDSIGTVTGLTDASGNRQASYSYDPYGQLTASSGNAAAGNPFRFAGGYQDPTGLYHYGQRYYDPALGRWTQQDNLSHLGDLNQADRYTYTGGDPVNNIDPGGFCVFCSIVGGFVTAGVAVSIIPATTLAGGVIGLSVGPEGAAVGGALGAAAGGFASACAGATASSYLAGGDQPVCPSPVNSIGAGLFGAVTSLL